MRAGLVLALVLLVSLSGSAWAASPEAIPGTIVPGVGVGKLRLGMSEAGARRILRRLGPPMPVSRERPHGVAGYREWHYPRFEVTFGGASYIVGFKARRLVWIEIRTWRNATRRGVRVSSTEPQLRAAYGRLPCRHGLYDGSPNVPHYCRLGALARRHTIFELAYESIVHGRPPPGPPTIAGIIVREPFIPLEP